MTETRRTLDALKPRELVELLDRLTIEEAATMDIDVDAIGRAIDPRKLGRTGLSTMLRAFARLAAEGADLALSKLAAVTFAKIITDASKDQLQSIMVDPALRAQVLDEVYRRMGTHLRQDRTGGLHAVVHWRLTGGAGEGGYDRYETLIENGVCSVNRDLEGQPRATITVSPVDFLKLITNNASAPVLFMTGKLKVRGDLAFAAGLTGLFDLPRA
ncbi:Sterol-binding [Alloactinosynnema sp. L-07]|uniref:SCP2 sterol-binding domain-containing protein n=1 Tax=Alloactinosynnema sp. L-07 TaxID=1653480 RepID=UPI00065EF356|nr:SCP2 sterol-binding domain-containing protein [Alloactinosynnema sp. L-07]CRK60594.1 Sterol-binding [Alloactinosynnema sp. L-07]